MTFTHSPPSSIQGLLQKIHCLAPETQPEIECSRGLQQNEALWSAQGPLHPERAASAEGIPTLDFNEPSKGLGLAGKKKAKSRVPLIFFSLIRQDLCSSKETCREASTREGGQGRERRPRKSSLKVNDGAVKCADMAPRLCHRSFVTFAPF